MTRFGGPSHPDGGALRHKYVLRAGAIGAIRSVTLAAGTVRYFPVTGNGSNAAYANVVQRGPGPGIVARAAFEINATNLSLGAVAIELVTSPSSDTPLSALASVVADPGDTGFQELPAGFAIEEATLLAWRVEVAGSGTCDFVTGILEVEPT